MKNIKREVTGPLFHQQVIYREDNLKQLLLISHLCLNILLYKGNVITIENSFSSAPAQSTSDSHSAVRRCAVYVQLSPGSIMDLQGHFTPEQTTELVCEKARQVCIRVLCHLQFCFYLFVPWVSLWKWSWGDLDPGIKNFLPSLPTEEHFWLHCLC